MILIFSPYPIFSFLRASSRRPSFHLCLGLGLDGPDLEGFVFVRCSCVLCGDRVWGDVGLSVGVCVRCATSGMCMGEGAHVFVMLG